MKMMKKAGFTLVELIVVITILAILGTIAFISLQGNTRDAKNSKVTSDLRTLGSAIETTLTKGDINLSNLVTTGNNAAGNAINVTNNGLATGTAFSGAVDFSGLTTGQSYSVGVLDFIALRQNGADFLDPNENPYIAATVVKDASDALYQLGGEVTENAGVTTYLKGNYVQWVGTDVASVITGSGATAITNGGSDTFSIYN